ncbi:hypothetical protein FLAVO9AF_130086 [Flavobacterium sp. 9AF]|nr:hypothetical protein FLAVO9AF_130086 [Flavobacterium sp. 9AF]
MKLKIFYSCGEEGIRTLDAL